jgi:Uma2 family endonuclease
MDPAKRRATYADLLAVPEQMVAEIVAGELHASPRPASPHAHAAWTVGQDIGPFGEKPGGARGPGGWWILFEPELHLGSDVLVPDLAGWRRGRMERIPRVAHFDLAPDWTCEIVSPDTARLDRIGKMPVYARAGVGHLWLLDPDARTLEVYRLEAGRWVVVGTFGGNATVRAEPFEALQLDLSRWWLD